MKELLLNYCRCNYWANQHLISLLLKLSDEQINQELGGSFGNIKKTVFHIWKAEAVWMQRLLMLENNYNLDYSGTFSEACDEWLRVSDSFIQFCKKQFDDRSFQHEVIYKTMKKDTFKNRVGDCIQHCMNHSTFHRGQLVNYLRMLGVEQIPSTDFITFQREKK